MIPWYKKWYQVDEIETETVLEKDLILIKMEHYFNQEKSPYNEYGKRRKRSSYEFDLNEHSGLFSIRDKGSWGWDPNHESDSFVAHGEILGDKVSSKIIITASIPIILIAVIAVILIILLNKSFYLFVMVFIPLGILYFWVREKLKEKLLDVDIEISKCLKS